MCHACMSFRQHARIYKPGCIRCPSIYVIFHTTSTRITVERPEGVVSDETVEGKRLSTSPRQGLGWLTFTFVPSYLRNKYLSRSLSSRLARGTCKHIFTLLVPSFVRRLRRYERTNERTNEVRTNEDMYIYVCAPRYGRGVRICTWRYRSMVLHKRLSLRTDIRS